MGKGLGDGGVLFLILILILILIFLSFSKSNIRDQVSSQNQPPFLFSTKSKSCISIDLRSNRGTYLSNHKKAVFLGDDDVRCQPYVGCPNYRPHMGW